MKGIGATDRPRIRVRMLLSIGVIALGLTFATAAASAPGDLDPTFGSQGIADISGGPIALQPDGKIVVAGSGTDGTGNPTITVTRLNADGTVDSAFGSGGTTAFKFAGLWLNSPDNFTHEGVSAIVVQPDGKIVLGGGSKSVFTGDFALARLNPDGTLDSSFGRNGAVLTDFFPPSDPRQPPFGSNEFIQAMALEPDGRLVAVGRASWIDANGASLIGVAVASYSQDGSPQIGRASSTDNLDVADVAVDPPGCLVVAENTALGMVLQRLRDPGASNSCAPFPASFTAGDFVHALAVDGAGRIVAVGSRATPDGGSAFLLARFNPDGTSDASFDGDGWATVRLTADGVDAANDVAVQPDGKLLVAGGGTGQFALARFLSNGSLDTTFGGGGVVTLPLGEATQVALTAAGQAVVRAGSVLTRILLDGGSTPNTPTGANVSVVPVDPATGTRPVRVTFHTVVAAGETTVAAATSPPPVLAGFQVGAPPTFYDISTTASFTGQIETCVSYAGMTLGGPPRLLHYDAGSWVDVTTSDDPATQTVCGTTTSLSPFLVAWRSADTTPPRISCGSADGVWHADNIVIACTANDLDSGLADPSDSSFSLSTHVADGEETADAATNTRSVCDTVGNCATAGPVRGNKVDRRAPTLTVPAAVVANAVTSAGAQVSFTAAATDGADPAPAVECMPRPGSVFAIGTTTVACTAKDAAGNRASASFVVTVKSAAQQIRDLIEKTRISLGLPALPATLETPLQDAINALVTNKPAACRAMTTFISAVRLLAGAGRLTSAQATDIVADANRIKGVVGCV